MKETECGNYIFVSDVICTGEKQDVDTVIKITNNYYIFLDNRDKV